MARLKPNSTVGGDIILGENQIDTKLATKLNDTANAVSASKLATTRNIALAGDVTGNVNFDGTGNVSITTVVGDDSHNHIVNNVDGLQTALDAKAANHSHPYLGSSSNAVSATKLATARTISIAGDVTGSTSFDGTGNVSITATVGDDSHNHIVGNVDGLQTALDSKANTHSHPYLGSSANAVSATKLATARTIALGGDATGSISFDGTANKTVTVVVKDDSHNHIVGNVDGLQTALDAKAANHSHPYLSTSGGIVTGGNVTVQKGIASNQSAITLDINNEGSPQISMTDRNDNYWSLGCDDADNNFSIHGSTTSQTIINNIVNPFFEITTAGVLKTSGHTIWNSNTFNPATKANTHSHPYLGSSANAVSATKLATTRNIALTGDVTGSVNFDGTGNVSITTTVGDDSHYHIIGNVDGLQSALDGKAATHTHPYLGSTSNAVSATKLATARTISLGGDASGSISFDGTANKTITVVIADDSHNHIIGNVDGLQTALDAKSATGHDHDYLSFSSGTLHEDVNGSPSFYHNEAHLDFELWHEGNFDPSSKADTHSHPYLGSNANAVSATKLATARSIALTGDVTGSVNFDGTGNVSITTTVGDDSHNHIVGNVDGLQTALDAKAATHSHPYLPLAGGTITGSVKIKTWTMQENTDGSFGFFV